MQTNFENKVNETYRRALMRGELHFIESTVNKVTENGIEVLILAIILKCGGGVRTIKFTKKLQFEIFLAPSLAKKPKAPYEPKDESQPKLKVNPFSPYSQDLFVQEYGKHVILLNKFCVVPNHLLVITKEFEKQMEPLNQEDLTALWYCMMQIKNQQTLAFYNCGDFSGASQSHKHMQIIPLPSDIRFSPPINGIIYTCQHKKPGEIFDFTELPYIHYVVLLDPQKLSGHLGHSYQEEVGQYLTETYHSLLNAMIKELGSSQSSASPTPLSYNFVITHTWMMIVPRHCEKYEQISVNSLGFTGMFLVKSEEELEFVKKVGILRILEGVAIPKSVRSRN
ncbi:9073_t:CDS:2 [Funneliformis mosseae]|uniref:9073_t:CDS:1 n=1 Tax=Funneliformis mosseae TaxID=27381 RepID=A0A9N9A8A7_FUNMO|nr:9073_t:CDS:2 [Funneliformis mosseae]